MKYLSYKKFRNKIFSRTLLSYIAVFSIPLVLLCLLSYSYIARLTEKQVEDIYHREIQNICADTDEKMMDLYTLSIQISLMDWVKKYNFTDSSKLNYNTMDSIEVNNIVKELTMFNVTSPLSSGIAVYFNEKDIVLSTYGRERGERFFSECIKYEDMDYSFWMDTLGRRNAASIILPQQAKIYENSCRVMTFIQSIPVQNKNFYSSLIFFIDVRKLEEQMKGNTVLGDCSISVFSPDFHLIAGEPMDEGMFGRLRKHIGESAEEGKSSYMIPVESKEVQYLFYSKSYFSEWYFVAAVPVTGQIQTARNIKVIMLLLGIAYAVMGLLIAFAFALRHYKPIDRLITLCRSKLYRESDWQVDFDLLEKSILEMITNEKRNEEKLEVYRPLARNAWLVGLIKGENAINGNFSVISAVLEIKFDYSRFLCIVSRLEKGRILHNYPMEKLNGDLRKKNIMIYICDIDSYMKAVIVNLDEVSDERLTAAEVLTGVEQNGIFFAGAGVSRVFDIMDKFPEAFSEACVAMNHYSVDSNERIIVYDSWNPLDIPLEGILPEKEIISCIKKGAVREAYDLALRAINRNLRQKKLTINQVKYLYYSFAITGLKALKELDIIDHPSIYPEHMFSTDNINELNGFLLELYREACSIVKTSTNDVADELIRSIVGYIENNITDNQLTLIKIAEHLKLSPGYVSRYFKRSTGVNLSDFLNYKRILLSRKYLEEGNTVLDTARMVGYDNDITYRRLFKKIFGITPGKLKEHQC